MENYINNLLFTYFPHIAFAVFWFGLITRFIVANKSIQAKSTQILAKDGVRKGNNLFHYGIIIVFFGHFTLFLPEEVYHIVMSTETKRMIALIFGTSFGIVTFIGMLMLFRRRLSNERVRFASSFHDYFILILLIVEAGLGLASVVTTANGTVSEYAALGEWAQKIITFQPNAGDVIEGHSILYKIHFTIGLVIFMIFPYTKLMHILVLPIAYFLRSSYQLIRRRV
ncbi:respiratory nitrate reductase subunit gamma [Gaoshiqia sediminis]|uniref:nitrate reductase (quinone) n=1 Tax=Gaoshiqia sediminis TaxID=2986998 RepID=A0AA41Y5M9_9BACT|nr:respiratory nitrate reductase subunit gamma [Gaoshiqia sediminis]MCW0482295.1 respiratory nitrate reductase subunit gamma [Gaoshiqia sediminis]